MKKENWIKLIVFFLILAASSCNKDTSEMIPFEEYFLDTTVSNWEVFENDTLVIIDNNTDLKKCIESSTETPEIDFETKTLILTGSTESHGAINITPKLFVKHKNEEHTLVLHRKFSLIAPPTITSWHIAILVNKIPSDVTIHRKIWY